ncbi:DUF6636 domain-containing protein [Mycobacteroides franklinii]|uniref:DUF6636 domain-containing protein n=1 Tax=Mycobacteroides franklinii TaxID=948102 RepID=UPI0009F6C573|nr:DUF6636 domain-containing protein [Mycobacteroides franklinii]
MAAMRAHAVAATVAAVSAAILPVVYAGADPSHTNEFRTPSHNIICLLSTGDNPDYNHVRCEIAQIAYLPPPPLPDCGSFAKSMGHMVFLYQGRPAGFQCAHDSISADIDVPVLAYGQSIQAGSFHCDSTEQGVDCADTGSGHGFRISRGGYDFT